MIKEAEKTKLFIDFEKKGYYMSNQRLDSSEFEEFPITQILPIEDLSINLRNTYIVIYENSKKEDILSRGRVKKEINNRYTFTDNTVVYLKGIKFLYNIDTRVVYEKEEKIKEDHIEPVNIARKAADMFSRFKDGYTIEYKNNEYHSSQFIEGEPTISTVDSTTTVFGNSTEKTKVTIKNYYTSSIENRIFNKELYKALTPDT